MKSESTNSMKSESSNSIGDLVLSKDECDALEKLFDRLVDSRNSETPKRSMTESSIGSSVGHADVDGDDGDESSDENDDTETETRSVEKLSKVKIQIKTEWLSNQRTSNNVVGPSKDDSSISEKVRRKRKRNRTLDYADLPSGGNDLW